MAASRPLCLCNPLCFSVSRFGKRSSRELKSAVLDFYNVDELSCAKNQLLEDVKSLETSVYLPIFQHDAVAKIGSFISLTTYSPS